MQSKSIIFLEATLAVSAAKQTHQHGGKDGCKSMQRIFVFTD